MDLNPRPLLPYPLFILHRMFLKTLWFFLDRDSYRLLSGTNCGTQDLSKLVSIF